MGIFDNIKINNYLKSFTLHTNHHKQSIYQI